MDVFGKALPDKSDSHGMRYVPIVAVTCLGIWLSLFSYEIITKSEKIVIKRDLGQVTRRLASLISEGAEKRRNDLVALQAFYAASEKVTKDEFKKFVLSIIDADSYVRAMEWIPKAPSSNMISMADEAGENDRTGSQPKKSANSEPIDDDIGVYFPVYLVEPQTGNDLLLGLNLAADPETAPNLKLARDTGEIIATERIEYFVNDAMQTVMRLIAPVYRHGESTDTEDERRRNLAGFFSGIYRLDEFIGTSIAGELPKTIDLYVFDNSSPETERLIYHHSSETPKETFSDVAAGSLRDKGLQDSATLRVGQRTWLLITKPTPQFFSDRHTLQAPLTFMGGVIATALVTGYLVMIQLGAVKSRRFAAAQLAAKGELQKEIGERESVEKALQASEARYRSHFEDSPISLWDEDFSAVMEWIREKRASGVTDFRTYFRDHPEAVAHCESLVKVVDVNKATLAMMRAESKEQLVNGGLSQAHTDESLKVFREQVVALAEGSTRFEGESVLRAIDGEEKQVTLSLIMTPGYEESLGKTLVSLVDVTKRKKAEEAVRESEEKYRTLFQQSRDAIIVVSREGEIIDANQACGELFGAEMDEIIGADILDFYYFPEERRLFLKQMDLKGFVTDWEWKVRRKDNTQRICLLTSSIWKQENGPMLGYLTIVRDVTDSKRLEEQLQQSQKMEALGTLTGGIAHDFNNLLQVINGYADLALMDLKVGDRCYDKFQEIKIASKSAAELTQALLTYSRKVESNLRPIDVNNVLQQVAKMLERTIPKMIVIETKPADLLPTIMADPAQLQQVLLNLAVNARDAMPNGGTIVIETAEAHIDSFEGSRLDLGPGRYVVCSLSDNGSGMDKKTVSRMFDPFFTTKEAGKGTGLGLSIVYGIVRNHRGGILCDSRPGQGTTFRIYLPATNRGGRDDADVAIEDFAEGSETILVVDDQDSVRNLAESILTKFGYDVLTASDGEEAVKVYGRHRDRILLSILDLMMPKMDGKDSLERILAINPDAKVIIASGYASNGSIEDAIACGAKASLRKPYVASELLELTRRVLDEG